MKFDTLLRDKVRYLLWYVDKLKRLELELILQGVDIDSEKYHFIQLGRTTTNQLIYLIINEEISNNTERKSLPALYDQLWIGEDIEGINRTFTGSDEYFQYVSDLFFNQFNGLLQGFFYDYSISMWSAFELSISTIFCEYSNGYEDKLKSSHLEKFKKFVINQIIPGASLTEIQFQKLHDSIARNKEKFLKRFPRYITSDDKINYLFKHVVKNTYTRDITKDKEIINFIRASRNTQHNNGIHTKKSIAVEFQGYKYELKQGEIGCYGSDINIIKKYHELLDIYTHLLFALPCQA